MLCVLACKINPHVARIWQTRVWSVFIIARDHFKEKHFLNLSEAAF